MKKLMALGCAVLPLWASESGAASAEPPTQVALNSAVTPTPFLTHDICGVLAEYLGNTDDLASFCRVNTTAHQAALESAAISYAKALQAGEPVAEETINVLCKAKDEQARAFVRETILHNLRTPCSNMIHLPKLIPPFLKDLVTDRTAEVQDPINTIVDQLCSEGVLHPAIAAHLAYSNRFYEDPNQPWSEDGLSSLHRVVKQKASQYIMLDDALKKGADLSTTQYVVMPNVDAKGEVLKSRKDQLDKLFSKRPDLTLVVTFGDEVEKIEDSFGFYNRLLPTSIKKIAFTGQKVKKIGNHFLAHNHHLVSVDFTNLPALKEIGTCFLHDSQALKSVILQNLPALELIGGFFLPSSNALKSFTLENLPALKKIGTCFLNKSEALNSLILQNLPALEEIEANFLSYSKALKSLTLQNLPALKKIGPGFLSSSKALRSFTLENLPALEEIGANFLSYSQAIESVILQNLPALEHILKGFAQSCPNLTAVKMTGINPELSIDSDFLKDAPATTGIFIDDPTIVTTIQNAHQGLAQIIVEERKAPETVEAPAESMPKTVAAPATGF